MLSPEQSRAARGWLDWSQSDLAEKAHVSQSTIRDFEKGRRTPIANNIDAMRRVFEGEGLTFENDANGNATGISFRIIPIEK
jgi:ribosome-binding protein aMBF1 (putative translation factor)